ncbi:polysaccharide deacetylase family protein [Novosphingobium flavum]|uniref:Polysaccharide deacetylase family protein n=1 Tax=Novosphingobium aerophilum TaxID=2839843 RepID=A0A7X1F658_9SPHN|nr:polysaccharide deacetylase family protein [Novosphingobium aerophilum]MBC2650789.1 polysaccharide deacetylase family protein [Novosphingobium aerophilum]MBC2661316.1 polysaccharide deacetylase family protein [Novosphingobium aerophilum]
MNVGKRLLASIHDVGPRFESEVDRLADLMAGVLGGPRFAMLVVPDHWGLAPLGEAPAFRARLRAWADQGVEMFVHGWYHKDMAEHAGLASFKARHMTAGEGEFLGLSQVEAARRMADGKALIEDAIGRPAAGFIAPAWLYGEGAMAALREGGFALAEDHMRVWDPATGATLAWGPVVTWASRSRTRQLSSLAVAALARNTFHALDVVRVATHPGDTGVPALLDSIRRTLGAFARRREAGRYAGLQPG